MIDLKKELLLNLKLSKLIKELNVSNVNTINRFLIILENENNKLIEKLSLNIESNLHPVFNDILFLNIFDFDDFPYFSHYGARIYNSLTRIKSLCRDGKKIYLGDLIRMTEEEMLSINNLGKKSVNILKEWLKKYNLKFGFDYGKWEPNNYEIFFEYGENNFDKIICKFLGKKND